MHTEATLEITRGQSGRLDVVKVIMPVWHKEIDNRTQKVDMPFLGMKFNVFGDMDMNQTCNDAVKSFCTLCEISGEGLEKELQLMGWERSSDSIFVFKIKESNFVFEQIIHTGDQIPQFINFTESCMEAALID